MAEETIPWTEFNDMHSGGGIKVDGYDRIYIQAPIDVAKTIFYNRFGHNPERVTCSCCGPDYSINEYPSLKQATGYPRNCRHLKTPRDDDGRYMNDLDVLQNNYYLEPGEDPPEGFQVANTPRFGDYVPVDEYVERDTVLVIESQEIHESEKTANWSHSPMH